MSRVVMPAVRLFILYSILLTFTPLKVTILFGFKQDQLKQEKKIQEGQKEKKNIPRNQLLDSILYLSWDPGFFLSWRERQGTWREENKVRECFSAFMCTLATINKRPKTGCLSTHVLTVITRCLYCLLHSNTQRKGRQKKRLRLLHNEKEQHYRKIRDSKLTP